MAPKRKFYVVWVGVEPGIYDSWRECRQQVQNYPGARYKSFDNIHEATAAYRGATEPQLDLMRSIVAGVGTEWNKPAPKQHAAQKRATDYPAAGITVDGACSGNPGVMEYRAVDIGSGTELFRRGADGSLTGTNNIAEYLALTHIAALLYSRGDNSTPIYSDSRTALSWFRHRHSKTTLERNDRTAPVLELLRRADAWNATHTIHNPIYKWDTDRWGEIPADFGRKQ